MTLLLKDPDAILDYSIDWGPEYLGEDNLAESHWSVAPQEDRGARVLASHFDAKIAVVQVAGGVPGRVYRLSNHVLTHSGQEDSRSITLRVESR